MPTQMELLKITQTEPSSPLLIYYKILFQFGNYLFLIPFRLVKKGDVHIVTWSRIHQVFCGLIQALVMFEYFSMIRFIDWSKLRESAFNSLHAVTCFACIIYGCGFIYTVWFRRDLFVKVVKHIESIELNATDNKWSSWKVNALATGICAWYITFAMTDTTLHDNSLLTSNVSGYFSQLWNEAEACYLFKKSGQHDPSPQAASRILSIFFVGVHFLVALPRVLLIQLLEVTVLLTAICLRHAIQDFLHFVRKYNSFQDFGDQILAQYSKLKELVQVVNGATSILTCCVIGVSLPFYASWTAIVFFEENVEWRHLLHFYFYFGSFFVLLNVAADFNAKSNQFYCWISSIENADQLTPNRMTSLLMDMQGHQIALKGSGIFIITYRFLGTILSVIVTYTIIIIQFQVTKRGYTSPINIEFLKFMSQNYPSFLNVSDYLN